MVGEGRAQGRRGGGLNTLSADHGVSLKKKGDERSLSAQYFST